MADEERPRKTLKDRAEELFQEVVEALESLIPAGQPDLVPIPIRRPIRRRR